MPIPSGTIDLLPFLGQLATYVNRRVSSKQHALHGSGHSDDADRGRAAQVGSAGKLWARKFRILKSRWSCLAIPAAPTPTLKNLTENWIKRHASNGAVALSMLLHAKGLTQKMLDDVRTYTLWVQSRYDGQVAFLTFLELARLLEGDRNPAKAKIRSADRPPAASSVAQPLIARQRHLRAVAIPPH